MELRTHFDNRAGVEHEGRISILRRYKASGEPMERRKEAMQILSPGQNPLASMEPEPISGRRRETHTINLLLGPLGALLVWFLVGGWLYFFGLPVR